MLCPVYKQGRALPCVVVVHLIICLSGQKTAVAFEAVRSCSLPRTSCQYLKGSSISSAQPPTAGFISSLGNLATLDKRTSCPAKAVLLTVLAV